MAGELVMENWQAEWEGLLLGQGTRYNIASFIGFDLPGMRTTDVERPLEHGVYAQTDLLTARTIELSLTVTGDTQEDAATRLEALKASFEPRTEEAPLVVQLPGFGKRLINARPRRCSFPMAGSGLAHPVLVQWLCPDPRMYAVDEQGDSVGLPTAAGGRSYDRVYDVSYGAMPLGGRIYVRNDGNVTTRPVIVIAGPVTDPVVRNLTTEQEERFSIDLASTDELVVDSVERTVMLNGTTSRLSALSTDSEFIELASGVNEITFAGDGSDPMARLAIVWRSAFL